MGIQKTLLIQLVRNFDLSFAFRIMAVKLVVKTLVISLSFIKIKLIVKIVEV